MFCAASEFQESDPTAYPQQWLVRNWSIATANCSCSYTISRQRMNETDQSKKQNSTYAAISSFNRSELCRRFNISSARSIFGVNPFFYKSVFQKQKKFAQHKNIPSKFPDLVLRLASRADFWDNPEIPTKEKTQLQTCLWGMLPSFLGVISDIPSFRGVISSSKDRICFVSRDLAKIQHKGNIIMPVLPNLTGGPFSDGLSLVLVLVDSSATRLTRRSTKWRPTTSITSTPCTQIQQISKLSTRRNFHVVLRHLAGDLKQAKLSETRGNVDQDFTFSKNET